MRRLAWYILIMTSIVVTVSSCGQSSSPVPSPRPTVTTPVLSSTSAEVSSSGSPLTDALVNSILDKGVDYVQRGDYDSAIEAFDQAIELDPEFAFSYSSRGVANYHKGDLDRAIADYTQAIELDPQRFTAFIGRAIIYDDKGDYDSAITDYNQAIALNPQEASAYVNRGLAYNNKGDYDQAIVDLERALELAPDWSFGQQVEALLEELQVSVTIEQDRYISLEELYRDAPTSSADQKDWEQWKDQYEGMQVKAKGRLSALSAHPQEGELYFIFTVINKEGNNEDNSTEIAFSVEDAYSITMGEDEGSYSVNDEKWFLMGDYYSFKGAASDYSKYDKGLALAGHDDVIILKGYLRDINIEEITVDNSVEERNGAEKSPTPTENSVEESDVAAKQYIYPESNVWVNNESGSTFVDVLAVDPETPSTIYAGTWDGLFKSTDGAESWSSVELTSTSYGPDIGAVVINSETPTTVYVGTRKGVYKTTNGGETWNEINTGLTDKNVTSLVIDPTKPTTIYAGTQIAVFKSTDSGESWHNVNTGLPLPPNIYVQALAIDPLSTPSVLYAGTAEGVFRSVDGGENWTEASSGLVMPRGFMNALVLDYVTPTTLYAGADESVFKTTDGGETWNAIYTIPATYDLIYALALDPAMPTTIYAGTGASIIKSTDAGKTWDVIYTDPENVLINTFALNPVTPTILYVGIYGGGVFVIHQPNSEP